MDNDQKIEFLGSRQLTSWMAEQQCSLALSTYQVGKLFLIGLQPNMRLDIFNRTFNRSMGLAATDQTMYLSTLFQIWRFENMLEPGENYNGYDRLFVPQVAWTTGDIDIHDIGIDGNGQPIFVSTLFSSLGTVSDRYSLKPAWRPNFISKLAAEDRCHLNGLAMIDGKPKYATAVARSDVGDGWRDRRQDGGVLIDIDSNEVLVEGLSMPHSPRWYRDKLWLLDSGNGFFGYVDLERGQFEPVTFCPGFGRGLDFVGDFAVIGLSMPRDDSSFSGLALDEALKSRDAEPRCAVQIIDLRTGDSVHWLRLSGAASELYDVRILPGVRRPMAIGLMTDEIRRMLKPDPNPVSATG